MRAAFRLVACLVLGLGLAGTVAAHEGHDHGAPPAALSANVAPRAEAASADFEIVAIARGAELEITLDAFQSNEPVDNADIEIDTPAGILKPVAKAGGRYVASAPFLAQPGTFDLAVTINSAGKLDLLTLSLDTRRPAAEQNAAASPSQSVSAGAGLQFASLAVVGAIVLAFLAGLGLSRFRSARGATAVVMLALAAAFAGATHTPAKAAQSARDVAQRLPDGTLFAPKATQRILAIRTRVTAAEAHAKSVELPGRIIPDPNASGLVQVATGGRLSPPEGGFKALGTAVKAGDVLAYVRPPLPSADVTVQAQQARELDQQISLLARKVERLTAIQQVIAKSQLEDAQIELKGLRERRANLERVNREPEPLRAPVDGVIAAANAVAGQMAEPSSVIFQIVDPDKLWVEALAFEPYELTREASARLPDGRRIQLAYLGAGLADRNQAIPVQFAISGSARGLRSGQFLTVFAKTSEARNGVALPRSAVLRGANGQALVYEHVGAERFAPREVRAVSLDGDTMLILSGLEAGKRIVTQGAELLDQIR